MEFFSNLTELSYLLLLFVMVVCPVLLLVTVAILFKLQLGSVAPVRHDRRAAQRVKGFAAIVGCLLSTYILAGQFLPHPFYITIGAAAGMIMIAYLINAFQNREVIRTGFKGVGFSNWMILGSIIGSLLVIAGMVGIYAMQ